MRSICDSSSLPNGKDFDSCQESSSPEAIDKVVIHKKRKRRISETETAVGDLKRPQSDPPIMTELPAKISVISTKRAASTESAESLVAKNLAQKRRKREFLLIFVPCHGRC